MISENYIKQIRTNYLSLILFCVKLKVSVTMRLVLQWQCRNEFEEEDAFNVITEAKKNTVEDSISFSNDVKCITMTHGIQKCLINWMIF